VGVSAGTIWAHLFTASNQKSAKEYSLLFEKEAANLFKETILRKELRSLVKSSVRCKI
jgi:hypothetical protein